MKRALLIVVLIAYSLASVGISLNYFYCCGKLKKVSLAVTADHKTCKSKAPKGCCENKTVTVKLKTDQKSFDQKQVHFNAPVSPDILHEDGFAYANPASNGSVTPLYKRPPPDILPSRQIMYCEFRI